MITSIPFNETLFIKSLRVSKDRYENVFIFVFKDSLNSLRAANLKQNLTISGFFFIKNVVYILSNKIQIYTQFLAI